MSVRTIRQLGNAELHGKRALVRVDFNVPLNDQGTVSDATRILAALPTLNSLLEKGAKVVILSHFGRPKGQASAKYSLRPVYEKLASAIAPVKVAFLESTVGKEAVQASNDMEAGSILLLENTRFYPGEESNDREFSRQLSELGDVYVNDAFGAAHRAHASTAGVVEFLKPAVAGLLLERELAFLGAALEKPDRPFVAVLGGSKISGKIDVIEALLPKVDKLLIGGAMACTFFRALGFETGGSLVEAERVDMARALMERAGNKLMLPIDATVAASMEDGTRAHSVARDSIVSGEAMYDIGPASAKLFAGEIARAGTVLWNGPMGVFEKPPFDAGTFAVAEAMALATEQGATTIVGGGDSAAAIAEAGLESKLTHISTGGGASLEFLEGKTLPGVAALDKE